MNFERLGDRAGLAAVPVEREGAQLGRGDVDRVPFEDDGGLRRISASQDRGRGRALAEGLEDGVLEVLEGLGGDGFGFLVAGYRYVDDAARGDV
jgi:hypothetical protein